MIEEEAAEAAPAPVADWRPTFGIPRHIGDPLDPKARFFEPPPAEIGQVRSVESDCALGVNPFGVNTRLFVVAIFSAIAAFATSWVCEQAQVKGPMFVNAVVAGVALLAAALGWYGTQFRKTCSYIGTHGLARFTCHGDAKNVVKREVYAFDPTHELRMNVTMHYHNGAYTGTSFNYRWTRPPKLKSFEISGRHNSKKDQPPAGNAFHFARAAEDAWSSYVLAFAGQQIDAGEEFVFRMDGSDHVRVAADGLVVCRGRQETPILFADLSSIDLEKGSLILTQKGAKKGVFGIGRSGIHEISCNSIANAKALVYLALGLLNQSRQAVRESGDPD